MGFITNTERTASLLAKTDVSIIKVNVSTFDSADEGTQLRLLKFFVETVTERLKQTTSILNQLRKI